MKHQPGQQRDQRPAAEPAATEWPARPAVSVAAAAASMITAPGSGIRRSAYWWMRPAASTSAPSSSCASAGRRTSAVNMSVPYTTAQSPPGHRHRRPGRCPRSRLRCAKPGETGGGVPRGCSTTRLRTLVVPRQRAGEQERQRAPASSRDQKPSAADPGHPPFLGEREPRTPGDQRNRDAEQHRRHHEHSQAVDGPGFD